MRPGRFTILTLTAILLAAGVRIDAQVIDPGESVGAPGPNAGVNQGDQDAGEKPPGSGSGPGEGQADRPRHPPVDLLPLIQVRTPVEEQRDRPASPVGGYVRFYLCEISQCRGLADSPPLDARIYRDDHRSWLSRWLIGRTFSRILTVKLSVARPNISATGTLAASVVQSSRSTGETWDSQINGRRFLTPFLRVDPDTIVTVDVNLSAATAVQSNITGAVLDVVTRAARLVQPSSQLVTPLNSERLRQTSEFIDQSVSALFAQNVAESSSNQFGPEEWANKTLVDIAAAFPMNRRLLRETNYRQIGRWQVMATSARVSMFSDVLLHAVPPDPDDPPAVPPAAPCDSLSSSDRQACLAFAGLTPARVLGFSVGENLTLGQAFLAEGAISAEMPRLLGTDANAQRAAARRLCSLVAAKAESLGLNRYDAAASVWAFSRDGQIDNDRRALILHENASCGSGALARALGLS
jgi:hypothetical protein